MTPATFRRLALEQSDAVEGSHMGHADFRAGGKIFASLTPDEACGVVKLTPEQQEERVGASVAGSGEVGASALGQTRQVTRPSGRIEVLRVQ